MQAQIVKNYERILLKGIDYHVRLKYKKPGQGIQNGKDLQTVCYTSHFPIVYTKNAQSSPAFLIFISL